jgi:hypothetical protein
MVKKSVIKNFKLSKKNKLVITAIVLFILITFGIGYYFYFLSDTKLTEMKCKLIGGKVVNTLDYFNENLDDLNFPNGGPCQEKKLIGEITGLKCPCVCCK